ncbi:hypothetical protein RJ639_008441, partial [Escallonia herrerae]
MDSHVCLSGPCSGGGLVAYSEVRSSPRVYADAVQGDIKKKKVVVLGTGWAGTSFLKNLKGHQYDVQVVSARNYFAFTPLLPSVTCGTVEARSIVEPVLNIVRKAVVHDNIILMVTFQAIKNIKVWMFNSGKLNVSRSMQKTRKSIVGQVKILIWVGKKNSLFDYDYLVVAMGASANTFNTPGVAENPHFLKEIEDAQRIRRSVIDCFERASLPSVIVGGGPTGVEFAAELHDFVHEDIAKLYPSLKDHVKITLLEAGDHILNMIIVLNTTYILRSGTYSIVARCNTVEQCGVNVGPSRSQMNHCFCGRKIPKRWVELKVRSMVVKVTDKEISTNERSTGATLSIPYGMVVWSTGIGTRPVIMDFMKQVGQ